ncbi:hypothetical protein EDD21DRAFT_379150 [Dissophora ornata]|nr:hypothetical protein EDD21DRAFT_379150 [Dissophora ornata]
MALPSFPQRDIPTSPLYMADNELESESENEGSSDSFTALSTRSPSLSPQLSLPEFDQHRMKRRRADPNGRHTDESNMRQLHVEPLPVQDQVVSGSPHCHQNSRAEDTDNHYLSSPSSTPSTSLLLSLSQHTDPSDSFSVLKPKKTVRFDETKNAVFGYQRGSTIALPNAEHDNEETDYDEMWREDPSNTNRHSGHGHSLTPLSRWSSMATSKMSGEPTLSDLEAASPIQIHKANQLGPAADEARSTREAESIMKECDPTSSDQTDQRLSCTNTASNLERLWSPPRAKKSFSDASAAKFMSNTSPPSSSDTPGFTGPRMIPLLRRQHSMPLMDTLESREMFNLEESRPLNRRGSRIEETFAKSDLESVIAPHVSQRQSGDQDIVMCEEPQRADWAHLISPPKRLAGGARGPVRNRKVAGRYQHPYRRPIMPVLDPVLPASTSSPPSAFSPPKLVRSASFTVTRQKAPPLLRRKASTTALMDTFR